MKIALAGNPNSGKTTMFNALTGSSEKVGNWAGVTVDKKEGIIKKKYTSVDENIIVVDLPGAYSMSPYTSEESITSKYIINESPDVIINVVDSTNLSRSLFFTTQLLELGIPLVVALNKSDINKKKQNTLDLSLLSEKLLCPVVETISTSSNGLKEVVQLALSNIGNIQKSPYVQGENEIYDKESSVLADRKRFDFVNNIVESVEKKSNSTYEKKTEDKIDSIITNKWFGIPIFALVMWLVFQISQNWLGKWIAEGITFESGKTIPGLVMIIEKFGDFISELLSDASPIIQTIAVDGIIGGVGAVIGFLPLVMVMYFLLALLEDCGYMSRVSVVLDPIFKKVGLSGKSVIPLVIGTGCSIPGIMACRTIRGEKERIATAMLTPFVPCGAKIPVIACFAGLFFPEHSWVSPLMYFLGLFLVFFGALIIKWLTGNKYKKSYFIIELPDYKIPSFFGAFKSMLNRGWSYIVKAGTIILVCNAVITIMLNYSWTFQSVEAEASILHDIATPFAFFLLPLGFGTWQLVSAAITGFIAKEEVVGTLGAVFTSLAISEDFELLQMGNGEEILGISAVAGLSYLMFNLFSPPCFAAIGAMNAEIKSKKWLFAGIGLQISVAYILSYFVYQIGTLITTSHVGDGFVQGLITVFVIISLIVFLKMFNSKKEIKPSK